MFDFHSLRHQFITDLVASGANPKIAQTLARHSTITLTMDRYTHVGLHDLTASVNSLPVVRLNSDASGESSLRATGTENADSVVPAVVPSASHQHRSELHQNAPRWQMTRARRTPQFRVSVGHFATIRAELHQAAEI